MIQPLLLRLARLSVLPILAATLAAARTLPAFPGAEGFGALARGGRGGEVVHVTTLADAGAAETTSSEAGIPYGIAAVV